MPSRVLKWPLAAALCAMVLAGPALAGEKTEAEKPEEAPPAKVEKPDPGLEARHKRVSKHIAEIEEKLQALQQEEARLSLNILKAKAKALETVKDKDALKKLREGERKAGVQEFIKIYTLCLKQLAGMEARYARVLRGGKRRLLRERERVSEEYQGRIDDLYDRVWKKRRKLLEQIAGFYRDIGEPKNVLAVYRAIYRQIPEEQREKELKLRETIRQLSEKLEPKKDEKDKKKNERKK